MFCFRYEGAKGFYKGLSVNLIRVIPATMITFGVYENVSCYLFARNQELKNWQPSNCFPAISIKVNHWKLCDLKQCMRLPWRMVRSSVQGVAQSINIPRSLPSIINNNLLCIVFHIIFVLVAIMMSPYLVLKQPTPRLQVHHLINQAAKVGVLSHTSIFIKVFKCNSWKLQ